MAPPEVAAANAARSMLVMTAAKLAELKLATTAATAAIALMKLTYSPKMISDYRFIMS
jgi:hypothetical protein